MKVLLSKHKENTDIEFAPIYFNSTTKSVAGPKHSLNKYFQDVFDRIDNWISGRSGWIIE